MLLGLRQNKYFFIMKKQFTTILLIFAVFLVPLTMRAETAIELAATINGYSTYSGGTGELIATANGNTVTVTGSLTDVTQTLYFNIDEGVTVVWEADISTVSSFTNPGNPELINMSGSGTFNIAGGSVVATNDGITAINAWGGNSTIIVSGGIVSATTGNTINAWNENSTVTVSGGVVGTITGVAINAPSVTVSGTGKVEATSEGGQAIGASGNVEVRGGEVSATTGIAIAAWGINPNVIVTGTGKVGATGADGQAISTPGNVEISGGEISSTTGSAIDAHGENSTVMVSGGTVSATTGTAINAPGNTSSVTVSGTGKVEATGADGQAISTPGNVEVSGGEVSATTGSAIGTHGDNSTVTVSGGTVSATTGTAIAAYNDNSTVIISGTGKIEAAGTVIGTPGNVEVSGGEVITTTDVDITINTINAWGDNSIVMVSGGKVSTTTGAAIGTAGNVEVSGGEVSATTGHAIHAWDANSTVTITGGLVFAYGNAIIGWGNVIGNSTGFTDATGTGVVIAWDEAAGNTSYTLGSTEDISQSPASATVGWNKNGTDYGISYANGTNAGFISLGVTVISSACDVASIESPAGATINGQTITASVTNDVTSQEVSVTTSPDASWKLYSDTACTNEITDTTMTLLVGENTAYIKVTAEDGTTAKIYTLVVTRAAATYTVTIPSSTNGSVSADVSSTTEGTTVTLTITPDSGYELDAISAYKTGDETTAVTLTGTGNTRTFAMPAFDVTVTATFKETLSLSVSPASLSFVAEGEQQTFTITSNTDWTVGSDASWATVSPTSGNNNGTVTVTAAANTATSQRTATITISGTGVTAQTVSVTQAGIPVVSVTSVTLDLASIELTAGETGQLTATISPSNATNQNVSWSSSNEAVATVSNTGLISAAGEGTATITVTTEDGNFTATCDVTVIAPPSTIAVTGVSLDNTSVSMWVDENRQLTATVAPNDATNQNVSWSSNNPAVATVSNTGLVTAVNKGTATITVTTDDGGFTASCAVEVLQQEIVVPDSTQTGADGKGTIVLSLTIPADVLFSGSFRLTLPNGVQVDLSVTHLMGDLASQLDLTIVQEADGSWTFTITPLTLRSITEMAYSQIMEIGYIVDETVPEGTYEAAISDLSFTFDDGTSITESELPVQLTVNLQTGIPELNAETGAYLHKDRLYVKSPVAETIQVYSVNGVLLYNFRKQAGAMDYVISNNQGSVLIVKGSSGWVKKVIR